jgi:flavin reductase (DIM6/NTAB) family NADH-FMN oxidoreductase RutF
VAVASSCGSCIILLQKKKKKNGVPHISGAVAVVQCVWLTSRLFHKHVVVAGRYQR